MARSRIASEQASDPRTVIPLRRFDGMAAGQTAPLQLQLLGSFAVGQGGRSIRTLPKKAQALLAYLAMQGGRSVPREQLAEMLWGHSSGEQARRSLRQCLMSLRAALKGGGNHALIAEGDTVALALGHAIAVDAPAFERLAAAQIEQDLDAAQALYRGEFLSGLQIASEPFTEWLLIERRRMASIMSDVLFRLAAAQLHAGKIEEAVHVAERLTALDPLREDGHRLLMQALSAAGRRDAALKHYERCIELLRRDLGVAPETPTIALAEEIRGGQAAPRAVVLTTAPAKLSIPLPDKASIAVLPFA